MNANDARTMSKDIEQHPAWMNLMSDIVYRAKQGYTDCRCNFNSACQEERDQITSALKKLGYTVELTNHEKWICIKW